MSLPLVSAGWDLSQVTEGEDVAWAAIFEEVVCNCRRATTSDPSFLFLHERPPTSPCSLGLFLERWWVLTCCVASCGWTRRQPNWANYVSFFPADEVTSVTVFTHKIFRQHLSPWHKSTSIMLIFFFNSLSSRCEPVWQKNWTNCLRIMASNKQRCLSPFQRECFHT